MKELCHVRKQVTVGWRLRDAAKGAAYIVIAHS